MHYTVVRESAGRLRLRLHAGSLDAGEARGIEACLCELAGVLGVELESAQSDLPAELVDLARERAGYTGDNAEEAAEVLLEARQQARKAKDWGTADAIRNGITALGLVVEDTPAGARLSRA